MPSLPRRGFYIWLTVFFLQANNYYSFLTAQSICLKKYIIHSWEFNYLKAYIIMIFYSFHGHGIGIHFHSFLCKAHLKWKCWVNDSNHKPWLRLVVFIFYLISLASLNHLFLILPKNMHNSTPKLSWKCQIAQVMVQMRLWTEIMRFVSEQVRIPHEASTDHCHHILMPKSQRVVLQDSLGGILSVLSHVSITKTLKKDDSIALKWTISIMRQEDSIHSFQAPVRKHWVAKNSVYCLHNWVPHR